MERVFIDTSAFYALMDKSDRFHADSAKTLKFLLNNEFELITTNYVVLETVALLQNRIGFEPARLWVQRMLKIIDVYFIDQALQESAFDLWVGLGSRKVSLVDCTSFVFMRKKGLEIAFTYDNHFKEQGFEIAGGP